MVSTSIGIDAVGTGVRSGGVAKAGSGPPWSLFAVEFLLEPPDQVSGKQKQYSNRKRVENRGPKPGHKKSSSDEKYSD